MNNAPWSVYLLRCADGSLYCGATPDLARRETAHQAGRGARYTRSRRPVLLQWSQALPTRSLALQLEARIKCLRRADKELFCSGSLALPHEAARGVWRF